MVKLSIILPVYREGDTLITLLTSLQPLRTQSVELIVVDGEGADAALPEVRQLCDQLLVTGAGRAHQMNTGAQVSRGQWLLFLHADSICSPELFTPFLAGSPGQWGFFSVAIAPRRPLLDLVACMMNWRSRLTRIGTGDQGLWVARQLFEQVQGFPAQWLMEDIALCKALKRRASPTWLPGKLQTSARRWEQRGWLATVLQMWWLRAQYALGVPANRLATKYYPQRVFYMAEQDVTGARKAVGEQ